MGVYVTSHNEENVFGAIVSVSAHHSSALWKVYFVYICVCGKRECNSARERTFNEILDVRYTL